MLRMILIQSVFGMKWHYVTWWKYWEWTGFNSPVSSAGMKEHKWMTVCMPQSFNICPPEGLWVIKCGWECPWSCHHALWRKATNWSFLEGVRRDERGQRRKKIKKPGPRTKHRVKAREGFSLYLWQWRSVIKGPFSCIPRGFWVIMLQH